ncbi:MAG TPA: cytochrome c [Kiloniellales bacterium]|nr:cytochrome c [Kiloniellales bacterium]
MVLAFAAAVGLGLAATPAVGQVPEKSDSPLATAETGPDSDDPAARGAYLLDAAGCLPCHTDPEDKAHPLAGGRALETPFGTFRAPNITPHPDDGIGRWSDQDFLRALQQGVSPGGAHYFPAFPYPSYSGMRDRDLRDIKAYIATLPPVARSNLEHDIDFPFGFRFLIGIWKRLFFEPERFEPDPNRSPEWNRGAYLVRHVGHCGECHSPRNSFGAADGDRALAGNPKGPDGKPVPNITPHPDDGIGDWTESDVAYFLATGFRPDGEFAGGPMAEVIEDSTGKLTDADRRAIAVYLLSQPARPES